MDRFITTTEAAQVTSLSASYVRQLANSGRIAYKKFGHVLMINKRSLMTYIGQADKWRELRKDGTLPITTKACDL